MRKITIPLHNNLFPVVVSLLWLTIQFFLFQKSGIVTTDEAAKYIREADRLYSGQSLSSPQFLLYGTYILFITSCKFLQVSITGIYLLQTLLSGLSLIAFYRLCNSLTKSEIAAKAGVGLLIICASYQSWNTHLYTESFFLSLQLIFLYKYFKSGLKNWQTILLLIAVLFARPTGILILTAVFIHILFFLIQNKKIRLSTVLYGTIITILLFALLNTFLSIGGSFDFKKPFVEGHIICDVPEAKVSQLDTTGIKNANTIQGIGILILKNPSFFFKLFQKRTAAYFGLTRAYYSQGHNLFLKAYFYPLYLFSFIALIQLLIRNNAFAIFAIAFIGLFYGSVLLSCDDWLNRFFMPIIPILILLSIHLNLSKKTLAH